MRLYFLISNDHFMQNTMSVIYCRC